MQIHFSRSADNTRYARTEGLRVYGQAEVALPLPWEERDPRDRQANDLLRFIEHYIASQSKRLLAGQTMHYGWTTLRFLQDEENESGGGAGVLLIEELQNPFKQDAAPTYSLGATRALRLLGLQNAALRRNKITGEADYPHRSKVAIVCSRLAHGSLADLRPLHLERLWKPDPTRSGWFLACVDPEHDHDNADELEQVHLLHLVERCPGLFPYLALPVESLLLLDTDQVLVFGPGEQNGQVDSSPPLRTLPSLGGVAVPR